MGHLQVYMLIPKTHTLGPFSRYAIWVQGCPFRCHGCMTPNALSFTEGTKVDIGDLARDILLEPGIEGITISGGEPSYQPGAIADLVAEIRKVKDLGVISYSGYTFAQLLKRAEKDSDVARFLNSIDILIDGQFREKLNDGKSLRGSSNQQVYALTDRYRSIIEKFYGQPRRQVEIHMKNNEMFLAGIPGREILEQWKNKIISGSNPK